MRQIVSIICLSVGIGLSGGPSASDWSPGSGRQEDNSASPLFGELCDAEIGVFEHIDYHKVARIHRRALNQIGILRISPSPDPQRLFEEFAKRLSLVAEVPRNPDHWPPRTIQSIIKTGGGDRDELAFVLLNLFAANGFETELVHLHRDQEQLFSSQIERVLVYLPVVDQAFDPTLPSNEQPKESGRTWLDGKPRVHRGYPVWRSAYNCPGTPVRAYYGKPDPADKR